MPKLSPEDLALTFTEYQADVAARPFRVHDYVGKDGNEVYRLKQRPLSIEGFENFIDGKYGMGHIQQYLENRDGNYIAHLSIIAHIRRIIREDQVSGGMAGVYHPNLTARINGLSEKSEQTIKSDVKLMNIDPLK